MDYPNEVFTTFSFLGFLMCLFPFPCHLKAHNAGTCLYIFWSGAGCLILGINSVVWYKNAIDWAPIWCEICTRIIVASSFGIPASTLCINRRLYLVQRAAKDNRPQFNKNRVIIFDLVVGLGLPLFSIAIYYISQGHRFNILEDIGCLAAVYGTWIAVVSCSLPPLLLGIISASYAICNIIAINKMRTRFKQLIGDHSNMTYSLYFRLMALAGVEVLCTVPVTGFYVIFNSTKGQLQPWISWEDTHSDFDRVDQYPSVIWHALGPTVAQQIELTRWLYVVCAILFFCFFGAAEEVREFYGPPFWYVCKRLGIDRHRSMEAIVFKRGSTLQTSHTRDEIHTSTVDRLSTPTIDAEKRGDEWSISRIDGPSVAQDPHHVDGSDIIHISPSFHPHLGSPEIAVSHHRKAIC